MAAEPDRLESIDPSQLADVCGGAQRVATTTSGASNDAVMTLLTQLSASIQDLANNRTQTDPTQRMMTMMMMGQGGGAAAAPPQQPAPIALPGGAGGPGSGSGW